MGQEYSPGMKLIFNQKAFDTYRNMYHQFGLGVKTGIDIEGESSGVTTKDTRAGNLIDFVMGQYEAYTPMQISQYITTLANGGERLTPHLLKEVRVSTEGQGVGKVIYTKEKEELNKVDTKPEYMARVKEGLYEMLHAPGAYGLGYVANKWQCSGKTGSSQSFKNTNGDGKNDTETITSNFIGYGPKDNPKMSLIVASPDSSFPNSGDVTSKVTKRITNRISDAYFGMFGMN